MASDPSQSPEPSPLPGQGPPPKQAAQLPAAAPMPMASPMKQAAGASFLSAMFFGRSKPGELVVYHHSSLFYWWPIWFFGYVMALITFFTDTHLAFVPSKTVPAFLDSGKVTIDEKTVDLAGRDILVLAEGKKNLKRRDATGEEQYLQPTLYISHRNGMGTLYLVMLLLVIIITNMHFRGLWSFFIIMVVVMLSIIFAVAGWWDNILAGLGNLSIHINMGGYILLSTVLLIFWSINFFLFDRQTYVIFSPGQVRMRLEIGGGETVYDTVGMVVQKQRTDLFRHWILGFGSGDLIVRPFNVSHPIELPNVLRVTYVVKRIEELVKEKVIVSGQQ
ncbi:MAG: hypothetical protein L0215_03190 [Gemmataceae bacterium]|nr:hypothetical protein [Gemmataceae bacterium]